MIPPVYPLLSAAPTVVAIVGTPPRIFRKVAPQNTARPYIVWRVVFGAPENYIGEIPAIDNYRTQIDYVANDDGECRALAQAARNVLQLHGTLIGVNVDEQDEATSLHRYSEDWSFWTRRT